MSTNPSASLPEMEELTHEDLELASVLQGVMGSGGPPERLPATGPDPESLSAEDVELGGLLADLLSEESEIEGQLQPSVSALVREHTAYEGPTHVAGAPTRSAIPVNTDPRPRSTDILDEALRLSEQAGLVAARPVPTVDEPREGDVLLMALERGGAAGLLRTSERPNFSGKLRGRAAGRMRRSRRG